MPIRKNNRCPQAWLDEVHLRQYRHGIETVKSHLESMGLERLRARTNAGFVLKVQSSLLALYHTPLIATTI